MDGLAPPVADGNIRKPEIDRHSRRPRAASVLAPRTPARYSCVSRAVLTCTCAAECSQSAVRGERHRDRAIAARSRRETLGPYGSTRQFCEQNGVLRGQGPGSASRLGSCHLSAWDLRLGSCPGNVLSEPLRHTRAPTERVRRCGRKTQGCGCGSFLYISP